MKMLRFSRLAVLVACIAAFASGCGGGGGGGSATTPEPPVMECPQGQVGTYPDCTDLPPAEPTDAEKIAAVRQELSSILSNAQARAGAASSAAAAIQTNADATAAQITDTISHSNAAQSALASIVSANTAATLATTLAEANTALGNARAAQGTLNTSASAIAGIQGAVQAATNQRQQREADALAATNGSSLIQHVRDNRKVYDDLLPLLPGSIPDTNLGTTAGANQATFPVYYLAADGTTPGTVYPRPRDTNQGVLAVTITTAGGAVSSHSKTGRIKDPGRLHQGFDLKNTAGTVFANAYTDISVSARVDNIQSRTPVADNTDTTDVNERYVYQADPDYLLAGIWLDDSTANPSIQAFAYGSQPITAADHDFCSTVDLTNTDALTKTCNQTSGLNTIASVLTVNTDKSYTYRGNANGAYMADGKASYFKADVSLDAEFQNVGGVGSGTIGGAVTNIMAGGQRLDGTIELQKQDITGTNGDLTAAFTSGVAAGVVEGNAYNGAWKGQFFGRRYDKRNVSPIDREPDPDTQTIEYTPGLPGSVAGTFYLNKLTGPGGDAGFIGAFGAHR